MSIEIKEEYLNKGLSGNELILYAYIDKRMHEDGECNDTMEEMSKNTNIGYRTIWRTMNKLTTKGFVKVKTVYELK